MYPGRFDYVAVRSVEEAVAAKAADGDEARVLAGGQSLLPMMKIRLASPARLIDINRIPGLDRIEHDDGHLRVGALVRHADVAASDLTFGAIASAAPWVADPLVRNLGTMCGAVAHCDPEGDWNSVLDSVTGQATLWMTSQAPHAHRTLFAMVAGLPEQNIRIISPDLGGGFGNKVPIYPGYVVATAASLLLGKPVKWIETRSENLISTGFARDYHMKGELALDAGGRILALRVDMLSDQGAFYADAQPTRFKAGLFHVVTGSYDFPAAHVRCAGAYTNKAPGGVAYRCSFRITEASFLIERLVQTAAYELGIDPAELRFRNFIRPEQFPYTTPTGFVYDSGDYPTALRKALDEVGYEGLREEQAAARAEGRLMGIGIAHFTEAVGAGPSKTYDIAGLKMFDSAELRVHPTGKAILKLGVKSQGQGHETTFAQFVAEELGIPVTDIKVVEGDTDDTPYGLGTYALPRSTPVGGAATAMVARQLADKARRIAAHLLEAADEDVERHSDRFSMQGSPDHSVSIQDVALAAYTNVPDGMEHGLEGVHYYDPPNLTYPNGAYVVVVVDVDADTGQWKVRRMVALDDCGVRINPMIVEGQIHGGLTEGFAMSSMQWITFDDDGNCIGSNFMDYLIPTAWETPRFELLETCTPSPHHPIGAKGVGESATVGSPAAFVNVVVDALAHLGVRNIDMPLLPDRVWAAIRSARGGRGEVGTGVLGAAASLAAAREPFALATVVWRRGPSSGKVGSKAIIRTDGRVEGWLGGACAEPTMVKLALDALRDGEARLVMLGSHDEPRRGEGTLTVPMACESEGAMEVYLEPILPRPHLVVVGGSPAVRTLTALAVAVDWDVAVVDRRGRPSDHPYPERVVDTLDLAALGVGEGSVVVVATQGHYDDIALEAALATRASYVGLVASAKRAAAVLELLAGRRVGDEALARVVAPAGLDLGPVDHPEIAVAVLADLVARRAAGKLGRAAAVAEVVTVVDPVCGMQVRPDRSEYTTRHGGADWWFCAAGCKAAFDADPAAYAASG